MILTAIDESIVFLDVANVDKQGPTWKEMVARAASARELTDGIVKHLDSVLADGIQTLEQVHLDAYSSLDKDGNWMKVLVM